jgi:hypothetical protein
MRYGRAITGTVLVLALAAIPAVGEAGQRQRSGSDRRGERSAQEAPRESSQNRERAVPRERSNGGQNQNVQRQSEAPRQNEGVRQSPRPQYESPRPTQRPQYESPRQTQRPQYESPRQSQRPQYESRQPQPQYQARRQNDTRGGYAVPRTYQRPLYSYDGRYNRRSYSPRIIRPSIVTVIPYRPYVYRPHFGLGIYYGSGGAYPYGYTPRGYYDPLPGRIYGGLRITGASRDAQVFADGYYVGIVDDFDGIFQHVNLEAGPHHIEIEEPGYEAVGFDVVVQPGRTITFRADMY